MAHVCNTNPCYYVLQLPNPKGLFVAPLPVLLSSDEVLLLAELVGTGLAAAEAAGAPRGPALNGLSSALRSPKLSEVLIRLDRLSKLTEPLIT